MSFSRAADRLQFFQDYVRNLSQDEAAVVFGATLPMAAYSTPACMPSRKPPESRAAFDNLFQSLADRRVHLLSQEYDATKLPTIYEFPREFRKLRTLLVQLLVDMCRPSQLRAGPFLRGFYFTGVRPVTVTTSGPALARENRSPKPPPKPATGRNGNFRYPRSCERPWPPKPRRRRRRNPPGAAVGISAPRFQRRASEGLPPP